MFDPALRGHDALRQRLLDRLQAGRLPGSLLFTGPEGIGKRRVALELAQRELCYTRSACGSCEGCRLFKSDPLPTELPTLLRIAPEGKAGLIRIGVIREDDLVEGGVIRWAHQAAPPRCHRWILIEEAHRLNGASANMLLKTLEEPPPGTHFLLVTHRPESVLQTIRSRCERIAFKPLSAGAAWEIAREQGWELPDREVWCALAGGTLRYLDPADFARARTQLEAWLDLANGAAFAERGAPLLPEKTSERSQAEQVGDGLDLLLRLLADLGRLREGRAARLQPWTEALGRVSPALDLRRVAARVHEAQRNLIRNPSAEGILREVAWELRS